jgi:CRISPR-associated protein Cas2
MFTLISYDVVQDKRRTNLLKLLRGYGTHVQYSVFECELDARQQRQLIQEMKAIIDPATDSIRLYQIERDAIARIQIIGIGTVSHTPLYYAVGPE